MCDNRELIYTQFARSINKFVEHKINKEQLYNDFVAMVEMSTEEERADRINYLNAVENHDLEADPFYRDLPYSNWHDALHMMKD